MWNLAKARLLMVVWVANDSCCEHKCAFAEGLGSGTKAEWGRTLVAGKTMVFLTFHSVVVLQELSVGFLFDGEDRVLVCRAIDKYGEGAGGRDSGQCGVRIKGRQIFCGLRPEGVRLSGSRGTKMCPI